MDHDENGIAPADRAKCGPDGRHTVPQPTDGPTSCPCGRVSRHPAAGASS